MNNYYFSYAGCSLEVSQFIKQFIDNLIYMAKRFTLMPEIDEYYIQKYFDRLKEVILKNNKESITLKIEFKNQKLWKDFFMIKPKYLNEVVKTLSVFVNQEEFNFNCYLEDIKLK